jgi:hypothetical protein
MIMHISSAATAVASGIAAPFVAIGKFARALLSLGNAVRATPQAPFPARPDGQLSADRPFAQVVPAGLTPSHSLLVLTEHTITSVANARVKPLPSAATCAIEMDNQVDLLVEYFLAAQNEVTLNEQVRTRPSASSIAAHAAATKHADRIERNLQTMFANENETGAPVVQGGPTNLTAAVRH